MRTLFGILTVIVIAIGMSACSSSDTSDGGVEVSVVEERPFPDLDSMKMSVFPPEYGKVPTFITVKETRWADAAPMEIYTPIGVDVRCVDLGPDRILDSALVVVPNPNGHGLLGEDYMLAPGTLVGWSEDSYTGIRELQRIYEKVLCGELGELDGMAYRIPIPASLEWVLRSYYERYREAATKS